MRRDYTELKEFLNDINVVYHTNYPFRNVATLRVGGNVAVYVIIKTEDKLFKVVEYFIKNDIEYNLVGDGNNVLVSDAGYDGVIIALKGEFEYFVFEGNEVIASASVRLERLSHEARIKNLTGFEFIALLPHTIGGAVASSLNAFGESIFDNIECLRVMEVRGKKIEINSYLKEEYLNLQRDGILSLKILSVIFKLSYEESAVIDAKVDWYKYVRGRVSPMLEANIGPVFDDFNNQACEMIARVGGLDMKVGYLEWHKSHPNYLINTSRNDEELACANHAIELIEETRKKIEQHYHITPELRVVVLGNNFLKEI